MPERAFTATFSRPIKEVLRKKVEAFTLEMGVIQDKAHKLPGKGMKTLAGGPARRISSRPDGKTIAEVSKDARTKLGINYLTLPWRGSTKNRDAIQMMKVFWKLVFGEGKLQSKVQLENALQACIRNPLTRGDYGRNSKLTSKIKKSSRKFIDTGQLFNAIRAKVRISRV